MDRQGPVGRFIARWAAPNIVRLARLRDEQKNLIIEIHGFFSGLS
jgi:hypothetical protein